MPKPRKTNSDPDARDNELRATCKVLESVAKSYPRGSAEREAVRQAADALVYLRSHQELLEAYEAYRRFCAKPLTKTQIRILERMGVTV
jgi:hypothetical protein